MTLLILSEITGAVIVYIKRRELSDLFKNSSFDFIHDKYTEDELSQNLAWNNIMYQVRERCYLIDKAYLVSQSSLSSI